jgi:uncharacterized membrane protein
MRLASLLLPAVLLVAAGPAAAQSRLAQQCAAFGEAQYRKLSNAIDKITALDFPPPALERLDARAGAQAVSSALTLRGRLTYRNGPPFETQFVCLLDAGRQPLFFYALPTLAVRAAPTPSLRGETTAPPAQAAILPLGRQETAPAADPPRPALAAGAVRLRGLVRDLGGRLQLQPCDGAPLPLEDRTPDLELSKTLMTLTAGQPGRPMFVELSGGRETGPGSGISALALHRAAVETAGCRERFDQREWLAISSAGEAPWRLEVTARDILVSVAGGPPAQRAAHAGPQKLDSGVAYTAADDPELNVTISERRCIDPQSGSLFAYAVEVHSAGRTLAGCAVHNPAMPAP